MNEISLISAAVAGILTFFSPCVLPLIPAYLSFISGISLEELKARSAQPRVLVGSFCFIGGFSLVFILLGATATFLGRFFLNNLRYFNILGGVLIIFFGLHLAGVLKIKLLNFEERVHLKNLRTSPGWAFLLGVFFAFGWSPCIGPILAAILLLASSQETVTQGLILLTVYSLGLAIPFLLTALALEQFLKMFAQVKKYFRIIEILAGIFLIWLGLMLLIKNIPMTVLLLVK